MQWFRVYNEILDDPKVAKMDGETFRCFVYLLAISSEQETDGIINMSIPDISWRIRIPINTLEAAIAYFLENNIITKENGSFIITNWKKRQFASDNVGQRVKRYREKQCNVTSNVSGNVIDTDTETETDIGSPPATSPPVEIPYKEIIDYLNLKTGKHFNHSSRETRTKIKARWGVNGSRRSLQDFKTVIDNKCAQWLKDEKMISYLRPETLFGTKFESYLNDTTVQQKESSW